MIWLEQLPPILTIKQIERLANIFDNAGQVVFGVVVLTPMITGFDKVNLVVLTLGIVVTLFCWLFSIGLSRRTS